MTYIFHTKISPSGYPTKTIFLEKVREENISYLFYFGLLAFLIDSYLLGDYSYSYLVSSF